MVLHHAYKPSRALDTYCTYADNYAEIAFDTSFTRRTPGLCADFSGFWPYLMEST